jgi:hypothetical protein
MTTTWTIERPVHFRRSGNGRGKEAQATPTTLLRAGEMASYAELGRLGHVTRARVCQIMNLTCLAPDLQEALLFLPRTERGRDRIILADLQPIAALLDWRQQRRRWAEWTKVGPGV